MIKVDMHLHSEFSERPSDWFLKRIGTKESYTDVNEIYRCAKERGMDLVTITDHNRIDGVLKLQQDHPEDVFISVESTVYFPENGCKIHLLIYDITQEQFNIIQRLREDIYCLRSYLLSNDILCSVAHAAYSVNNKLDCEVLEKLILLFNNFEKENASHNPIFNDIWINILKSLTPDRISDLENRYSIKPWGETPWKKGFTGGSDDHSGLFIARKYTLTKGRTKKDFICELKGSNGLAEGEETDFRILPFMIYKIAWDFLTHENNEASELFKTLSNLLLTTKKTGIKGLIESWAKKRSFKNNPVSKFINELNKAIEDKDFNFADKNDLETLYNIISSLSDNYFKMLFKSFEKNYKRKNFGHIIRNISAMLPAVFLSIPFYSNLRHINLNRQLFTDLGKRFNLKKKSKDRKILWFSDTINDVNGIAESMKKIASTAHQYNYELKVVVCGEPSVPLNNVINLPSVYSYTPNFYNSKSLSIPSIMRSIEIINREKPDQVVLSTPGPVGILGLIIGKLLNVHCTGIYHTDFSAFAYEVFKDEGIENFVMKAMKLFYSLADDIKVPSDYYITLLESRGYDKTKMSLLKRGIDLTLFNPKKRVETRNFQLMWAGRLGKEKNIEFLYDIYSLIQKTHPDITLTIAGDGPELALYKKLFSSCTNVTFTGRLSRADLTNLYASMDTLVFPSIVDTFGMVVLEAQASGLPALVTNAGGPQEIIIPDQTGYVLDLQSASKWAKKIIELYNMKRNEPDTYLKLRLNSRKNVETRYCWQGMIEDVISL